MTGLLDEDKTNSTHKNKLMGEQNKITKYYGTQLDKLTSEQNRSQNADAHTLTVLFTVTLIFILQKVTKSDLLRRYKGAIQAHWPANVTKPPQLKQMAIYGCQDLCPGFCSFPRVTASQHSAHHKLLLFIRHILNIGILNDLNIVSK